MFEKINITKEQAEKHIIGKSRSEFIKKLDTMEKLLTDWSSGFLNDKTFVLQTCKLLDEIRHFITMYK